MRHRAGDEVHDVAALIVQAVGARRVGEADLRQPLQHRVHGGQPVFRDVMQDYLADVRSAVLHEQLSIDQWDPEAPTTQDG